MPQPCHIGRSATVNDGWPRSRSLGELGALPSRSDLRTLNDPNHQAYKADVSAGHRVQGRPYHSRMAVRPSQNWRDLMAQEAREVAAGTLDPECAYMADSYSESFLSDTDAVLAGFERDVSALTEPSDEQVLHVVERVVLALNEVNDRHENSGYDTDEREQLCIFIDAVLTQHGIDVASLASRDGVSRYEITDRWRRW